MKIENCVLQEEGFYLPKFEHNSIGTIDKVTQALVFSLAKFSLSFLLESSLYIISCAFCCFEHRDLEISQSTKGNE